MVTQCFSFCVQAEDGIRDTSVTGVQTCALPISTCLQRPSKTCDWAASPTCRWNTAWCMPTAAGCGSRPAATSPSVTPRADRKSVGRERVESRVGGGARKKKKGKGEEQDREQPAT